MPQLLTIGHSTHSIEYFISLLREHQVEAVADVRSVPASRFRPQFNKKPLQNSLKASGIRYAFLGEELGARSQDPTCYIDGKVKYRLLAQTPNFRKGISRILDGASHGRIALMCTERDPLDCHRTVLISRVLSDHGIGVSHILANGGIESHADAMNRLLTMHGLAHPSLLETDDEMLARALDLQESEIAYIDKQLVIGL